MLIRGRVLMYGYNNVFSVSKNISIYAKWAVIGSGNSNIITYILYDKTTV